MEKLNVFLSRNWFKQHYTDVILLFFGKLCGIWKIYPIATGTETTVEVWKYENSFAGMFGVINLTKIYVRNLSKCQIFLWIHKKWVNRERLWKYVKLCHSEFAVINMIILLWRWRTEFADNGTISESRIEKAFNLWGSQR